MDVNRLQIRRAAILAIGFGVLILMGTGVIDRLLLGVFLCSGLILGWLNAQLTLRSATRIADSERPSKQRLAGSTAVRLAVITVIALAVAILARPNGFGIFFGLATFQFLLILNTVLPELKALRQTS
ncbi:hypothetical protein [Nocardia sp. NPDC052566]|uniref:hypothetical protein n=1 Tax=Nocardia sp. NPDC052566 TaxID=3364330 RepID=UPI0037C850CE